MHRERAYPGEMNNIEVRHRARVTEIVFNRPEKRNAMSLELMEEVTDALLRSTTAAEAVVISAQGPVFSAGHDISEMLDRDEAFYRKLFEVCTQMMETIRALPQPVLAKVHGLATAAGCQLVAACDLAVAAEEARFATPGVRIGLFCSTPMVPLTRAVGRKRALEMLLTAEPISAQTALEWGLVNRVVPAGQLDQAVDDLVNQIIRFSPTIVRLGKRTFYQQIELDESGAYGLTKEVMTSNAQLEDAQEGMSAFLEKRSPRW